MIKKLALVLTGFVLAAVVFGVVGFAYAQTQNPPDADGICPFCDDAEGDVGRGGMMRGSDWMAHGGMMDFDEDEYGPMHDSMMAAFAEALGLDVEELETRHAAGETMWQIAEAQGYNLEAFNALMFETRSAALDQAVADGLLTQEQADWMQSRWETMQTNGFRPGSGNCQGDGFSGRGGMMHGGRWSGNQ